jgi:NAD(P)H-dependent flavin oxidoreductase YrpB (nitropropane dioxygenase family)
MTTEASHIYQAPTGSIAGPELCAAVAVAGGMGSMGLAWTEPDLARRYVREVFERLGSAPGGAPSCRFQVNFVLHFEPSALIAVLEEGAPVVTFSWGDPAPYVELVKSFGARLGIQVVSPEGAKRAIDIGADFLVCQGIEAGGHVQSSTPLDILLPQILDVAGATPVVAAGGLADRADVARVLRMGASGAMLGTRFVATQESRAHETYKRKLVEARDTALTICFDGGWPNAPHRVLRNRTFTQWEAAGSPRPGRRPGEGDLLGPDVVRYDDTAPRDGMTGEIEEMCLYAGMGVGRITDVPSAGELVVRLQRSLAVPAEFS